MPNWASGWVEVCGEPKNVVNFCKHFLYDGDRKEDDLPKKYFARSFIYENWEDFKKNDLGGDCASFSVDFAWSCHSCMVDGYPNGDKKCITLMEACKLYKVSVNIETEEEGMMFSEDIKCDKEGNITENCATILPRCEKCEERSATTEESDDGFLCSKCRMTPLQKIVKAKVGEENG